jgi:type VI secretion system protein ImpE
MGALLYCGVLAAERARQETFEKEEYSSGEDAPAFSGMLNGQPFESLSDADPRIGPRLETFAAGTYIWIPFAHIASLEIQAPRRLRDLLWVPAMLRTGPGFKGTELGEVLIPALSPLSWRNADDAVRLGRATVWDDDIPYGQKMLLVDGEEIPLLELRSLKVQPAAAAAEGVG